MRRHAPARRCQVFTLAHPTQASILGGFAPTGYGDTWDTGIRARHVIETYASPQSRLGIARDKVKGIIKFRRRGRPPCLPSDGTGQPPSGAGTGARPYEEPRTPAVAGILARTPAAAWRVFARRGWCLYGVASASVLIRVFSSSVAISSDQCSPRRPRRRGGAEES